VKSAFAPDDSGGASASQPSPTPKLGAAERRLAPQAGFEAASAEGYGVQASNPPVNRLMQVIYPVGSSMVYLMLHRRCSPVFGSKLFTAEPSIVLDAVPDVADRQVNRTRLRMLRSSGTRFNSVTISYGPRREPAARLITSSPA
jgi:hypothetical protein